MGDETTQEKTFYERVVDWTGALVVIGVALLLFSIFLAASIALISYAVGAQPPYDEVELEVYERWEEFFPGEGALAVEIIRCEGWNTTSGFDVAHISPTDDAGPFQINQVHGRPGGVIEGEWPDRVQRLDSNISVALVLRHRAGLRYENPTTVDLYVDWRNSLPCWGWAIEDIEGLLAAPTPTATPRPRATPAYLPTAEPTFEVMIVPTVEPTPTAEPTPTPRVNTLTGTEDPTQTEEVFSGLLLVVMVLAVAAFVVSFGR